MFKRIVFLLMLVCVVHTFVVPESVSAKAAERKILDETVTKYKEIASTWEPTIKKHAKNLFWILATISLVYTFGYMIVRGQFTLGDFFGEFIRFSISLGFFYFLLENGTYIASTLIQSLHDIGRDASSTYVLQLTPSNLLTFGLDLIVDTMEETMPKVGLAMGIVLLVIAVIIALLFAFIAAQMIILLITAWVMVYAGIFYLGFGGGRWTTDIAINYFKTVLGLAVQLFSFCLLIGIGQQQIVQMIQKAKQVKTIKVSGVWATITGNTEIQTTALTIPDAVIILCMAVVLVFLVSKVPPFIAGVLSGASTGGIQTGSVGGAMAMGGAVAGAVTGGAAAAAMVGKQAVGAGMALNSAYQAGNTSFQSDVSGLGGGGGAGDMKGLGEAMNSSMTGVGNMLADMVSTEAGAADGVAGGGMSFMNDAGGGSSSEQSTGGSAMGSGTAMNSGDVSDGVGTGGESFSQTLGTPSPSMAEGGAGSMSISEQIEAESGLKASGVGSMGVTSDKPTAESTEKQSGMLGNLAKGMLASAKANIQATTLGGKVSAHIEAMNPTDHAADNVAPEGATTGSDAQSTVAAIPPSGTESFDVGASIEGVNDTGNGAVETGTEGDAETKRLIDKYGFDPRKIGLPDES